MNAWENYRTQTIQNMSTRTTTVNNGQPGPVDTDLNPAAGPFAETLKGFLAIKRYGQGDQIAYLASPEASFVTGASLTIDGGFAA
jgi:NAD(P)-dependent dehydrogenase (short-subunit alcohol dehydrogenase family)